MGLVIWARPRSAKDIGMFCLIRKYKLAIKKVVTIPSDCPQNVDKAKVERLNRKMPVPNRDFWGVR